MLALLVYDRVLRFPTEINLIWKKDIRIAAVLYTLTCYPIIILFMGTFIINNVPVNIQVYFIAIWCKSCR